MLSQQPRRPGRRMPTMKACSMTLIDFLAASGVLAWLFAVWRCYRYGADALKRLRWALFGYRKRRKQSI